MSDYPLTSTWAEVDAAAQAVKNGLPKANLSGAVQASLEKADSALQPTTGLTVAAQAEKTASMTTPIGADSSGKLWADTLMHDDAKESLLSLLAKCAYVSNDAQADYDRLAQALSAQLLYIVADYAQDRTIYDSDTLDALKEGDDLIVTAYYDDGSHIDLEDSVYTLSGTLAAGTSTITVTYGGKTTTFDVTVTTTRLYTLSNHVFNGTGDYVDTGIDLLSTDKNFTIAVDVDMTASLQSKGITNWSITSCIYGSSPYDGLELKANNQSPYYGSMQYMGSWLASNNLITDFNQSTTGRARFVITHANGSGILKLQVKVGDNAIASRTITASFSAKQRLNARVGGNASSQFFAGTMTNYIIDSVVWSDAKIAEFFS